MIATGDDQQWSSHLVSHYLNLLGHQRFALAIDHADRVFPQTNVKAERMNSV